MPRIRNMSQLSIHSFSLLILLFLSPFPNRTHARDPHVIKFKSPGLYPEGITWDPSAQHFIVGSLRGGTFHSISDAGVVEALSLTLTLDSSFSGFPENTTILGLAVDHRRNRLLAAVNTPSPHLASFDLSRSSLRLLFLSPLPSSSSDQPAVANDVTVDAAGDAYVSNSGGNVIWKVDINGSPSILSRSPLFTHYPVDRTSPYSYCGLNGAVYMPSKGYLLVVQSNTGKMFKVDAVDGTARTVNLPEDLTLADGIAVKEDGVVLVVSMNSAWFLKSDDSWGSGVVIDKIALDKEGTPTSVTVGGGGRAYVIYGYVQEGMKGNVEEREWFRIEEVQSKRESEGESVWPYVFIGLGLLYVVFWRFQMTQLVQKICLLYTSDAADE